MATKKMQDGGATATKGNTKYQYGTTPYRPGGPNGLFVNKTKTKKSGKTVTKDATNNLVMSPDKPMTSEFKTTIKKTITDKSGNSKTKDVKGTKRKFDKLFRQGQKATESERKESQAKKGGSVKAYKTGGVKKPLRKAQAGTSVGPYAASDLPPASKDKNTYAGPINEQETKEMDERYPSTVGKAPIMEGRGNKKTGPISPKGVEAYYRRNDENYLRSNDPSVQSWNKVKNENKAGEYYPTTNNANFRKGGSMKKMKTGGMANSNAKVQASKKAGSTGVKSGTNPKASASKVAKGKVGGSSVAPKNAVPKAKYGMTMKAGGTKPKAMYGASMKPSMMKMGGTKKK
jgi:hypothetical protein